MVASYISNAMNVPVEVAANITSAPVRSVG
jgi:hypothetical protein